MGTRRAKREEKEEEEDRISSLSDDVLSQILSFLKVGEALKTCVLSKRWGKVWTQIHRIHLDNRSSVRILNHTLPWKEVNQRRTSYVNFVNAIFTPNNNNNNNDRRISFFGSFCLWHFFCPTSRNVAEEIHNLAQWIAAAMTNPHLENFEFRLRFNPGLSPFKMPQTLFECQKLVTLQLNYQVNYDLAFPIHLDVPETVCLSSLKKLHLRHVRFQDESCLKNLLLGCPVLEELYMGEIHEPCDRDGGGGLRKHNVFVFSPSLKILTVKTAIFHGCYFVRAPKLEYLHFSEPRIWGFTITDSPSLVSAVINVCTYTNPLLSVFKLLQGVSNVQDLELFAQGMTMPMEDEVANFPEFHNLIRLKLRDCRINGIFPWILQHSPRLKHLIFDKSFFWSNPPFKWISPERVPECLTSHLETIEIGLAHQDVGEEALKMIGYLLDQGKVLKKMVISPAG